MKRLLVFFWRHCPTFVLRIAYRWTARVVTAALARRGGVSVYARGSFALGRTVPGLSDIDLIAMVDGGRPGTAGVVEVRDRWRRVREVFPLARALVDVGVLGRVDVVDAMRGPTQVFGLDGATRLAAHRGPDKMPLGLLVRPGLYGPTADWKLLRGEELRPPQTPWPEQIGWLAAWMELQHWWRHAVRVVAQPDSRRAAYLSLRLMVESARVWLWVIHDAAAGDGHDVLAKSAARLPPSPALDLAVRLARRPGRAASLDPQVVLGWLFERTEEVANELARRAGVSPATPVTLLGGRGSDERRPLPEPVDSGGSSSGRSEVARHGHVVERKARTSGTSGAAALFARGIVHDDESRGHHRRRGQDVEGPAQLLRTGTGDHDAEQPGHDGRVASVFLSVSVASVVHVSARSPATLSELDDFRQRGRRTRCSRANPSGQGGRPSSA